MPWLNVYVALYSEQVGIVSTKQMLRPRRAIYSCAREKAANA